ncbi:MAG: hypothetical protein V3W26_04575, partial [Thermodesulfobacteriota bacterium]
PYRPALSASHVFMELQKYSKKQFDPDVVQSFFNLLYKEVAGQNRPTIMPFLKGKFKEGVKSIVLDKNYGLLNARK